MGYCPQESGPLYGCLHEKEYPFKMGLRVAESSKISLKN